MSTNIYLTPKEWDEKRLEVSQHHPEADELNKELQEHIKKLKTHGTKQGPERSCETIAIAASSQKPEITRLNNICIRVYATELKPKKAEETI